MQINITTHHFELNDSNKSFWEQSVLKVLNKFHLNNENDIIHIDVEKTKENLYLSKVELICIPSTYNTFFKINSYNFNEIIKDITHHLKENISEHKRKIVDTTQHKKSIKEQALLNTTEEFIFEDNND